jgi:hypothetical protein
MLAQQLFLVSTIALTDFPVSVVSNMGIGALSDMGRVSVQLSFGGLDRSIWPGKLEM